MKSMKADIVERLRAWVHTVKAVPASDLMDEAADEIERLRADWPDQLKEARSEIERLRLSAKSDFPVSENAASEDNGPAANSTSNHRTGCGECRTGTGPQPTLTADEREVLLAIEADAAYRAMWRTGQVVRGLLDRLG